jgi:hypothetical protein
MIELLDWGIQLNCRTQKCYCEPQDMRKSAPCRIKVRLAGLLSLVLAFGLMAGACTHTSPPSNNPGNANQNASQSKAANDNATAKPEQKTTGSIDVTSKPPGARVLLVATDEGGAGEPQPKGITPTTITELAPGKYTVDLEKPGYRFSQTEVKVKAGATVKVAAALKKQ